TGPSFTHLAFADNILLCRRATRKEAIAFLKCLQQYCSWSGQKVNNKKSNVHVSKNLRGAKVRDLIRILGFKPLVGSGRYLGLPLLFKKTRSKTWTTFVKESNSG
ncbi:hypothetical protein TorRG33x02_303670, partial [Trema orientale]